MKYGSLCSGIAGLDRAVEAVWPDAAPAWFCESDPHARTILERHFPAVPIWPDLRTQDWTSVEPVELVSAGYPCQPFSFAGRRAGATDPRHLWPAVIAAVRVLRPRLVVLENVAGHLGLGFDSVLADLAEAGFDAEWATVRASDVGACHRRERLFVLAHAISEPVRVLARGLGGEEGADQGAGDQRQRVRAHDSDGRPDVAPDSAGQREPDESDGCDAAGQSFGAFAGASGRTGTGHPAAGTRLDRRSAAIVATAPDANGGRLEGGAQPDGRPLGPGLGSPRRADLDGRGPAPADATHVGRERGGEAR